MAHLRARQVLLLRRTEALEKELALLRPQLEAADAVIGSWRKLPRWRGRDLEPVEFLRLEFPPEDRDAPSLPRDEVVRFQWGELPRLCRGALRAAGRPLTSDDIRAAIAAPRGIAPEHRNWVVLGTLVSKALDNMARTHQLERIVAEGTEDRWGLLQRTSRRKPVQPEAEGQRA